MFRAMFRVGGVICASYGVAQGKVRGVGHTHTSAPQVRMRDHAGVYLPTPALHCVIPFLPVIFFLTEAC
jgi:hypothetical protein